MTYPTTRRRRRAGTATAEFAVILALIMVPALIGLWELGRMAEVEQIISNAARDAARRAASSQITTAQTAQVVTDYLNNANIQTTNVQTTIQNLNQGQSVTYGGGSPSAGADFSLTNAAQNDRLQVTVSIPFNDFRWATISRMFASANLTGRATWYALKDKDFPSIGDPPIE